MLDIVIRIDEWLQGMLTPLACIMLWGAFSAIFSMFVYRSCSPQAKLQLLKTEHRQVRSCLMQHDGDFNTLQKLIIRDLGLSLKQIVMILPAFIVSVLPVLALMFCLFVQYGYALPSTGERITLRFQPQSTTHEIIWPDAGSPTNISDDEGNKLLTLPLTAAIPEITKEYWLTTLFPNPIGNLPEQTAVESVHIGIPEKAYTSFGPGWSRGFEFWYIVSLLVVSLFIKCRFRIV